MKIKSLVIFLLITYSCNNSKKGSNNSKLVIPEKADKECNYLENSRYLGNLKINTISIEGKTIDPIDNSNGFKNGKFNFFLKDNHVFKKAYELRICKKKSIHVEYYQDVTRTIDLESYIEYNKTFFTTKGNVFFWWKNSEGHLIIPINDADPQTFKPFDNICGGTDEKTVYYGCPNFGVSKLNIPITSKFKFIPKSNNYWNSPKHYVIIDNLVYDIKRNLKKGYYLELDNSITIENLMKTSKV